MAPPSSFKEALLHDHNPNSEIVVSESGPAVVPSGHEAVPGTSGTQVDVNGSDQDPPPPPSFPETIVLDDLPQVKQDIAELSKSCLFAKMLSAPLDIRTIRARTKAD